MWIEIGPDLYVNLDHITTVNGVSNDSGHIIGFMLTVGNEKFNSFDVDLYIAVKGHLDRNSLPK